MLQRLGSVEAVVAAPPPVSFLPSPNALRQRGHQGAGVPANSDLWVHVLIGGDIKIN